MRILVLVVLGVWALFWLALATAVVGQGDVIGMAAFMVLAGLPWVWLREIMGLMSPRA